MSEPDAFGLAGDRMRIEEQGDQTIVTFGDKGGGRTCGTCTLCCKLLPIMYPPLHKPAGQRCPHQRHSKGCAIYSTRPLPCRTWACRWLADPEAAALPRPDRCHYVIDIEIDHISVGTGEGRSDYGALQVWIDPAYPDAHRDPALRRYVEYIAIKHGWPTIVRYDERRAIVLIAPALNDGGEWIEKSSDLEVVPRERLPSRIANVVLEHDEG